jgi:hypothetical protein
MLNANYSWQAPYVKAVLETDSEKRIECIQEAEKAIEERLKSQIPTDSPEHCSLTAIRRTLVSLKAKRAVVFDLN